MNKKDLNKIIDIAESLGFAVKNENDYFLFSQFSPAGQDFNIEVNINTLKELSDELNEQYENYDCSYETYLWLDNSGHGTNGAPYDMKDVYEDMEWCKEKLGDLAKAIENIL
jgi:hypothetical protein